MMWHFLLAALAMLLILPLFGFVGCMLQTGGLEVAESYPLMTR